MLGTIVLGCRPNVVKAAPIVRELRKRGVPFRLVATGQHNTDAMMGQIMRDLEMPDPDAHFGAVLYRSGKTHEGQTAAVMVEMGVELREHRPDWLVVLGDVDSTLGAALAAVKLGVKIAHVEAGLRSHDWAMPEEVNRVLVDRMSDLLLTPDADTHRSMCLIDCRDGFDTHPETRKPEARTVCVGNVMMDSLRWALAKLDAEDYSHGRVGVAFANGITKPYAVLTVHRPSNVDSEDGWTRVVEKLTEFARKHPRMPVIWPCHPRSRAMLSSDALYHERIGVGIEAIDPLGYLDMVALLRDAALVITDSGGVLEEAMYLSKEIVSLRDPKKNERQHLLEHGVPDCWREDAAPKIVDALLA